MGRTISLTDKEIVALRHVAEEWCEIIGDREADGYERAEETLKDGLGSALRKLYKGCVGEDHYREYKFKSEKK